LSLLSNDPLLFSPLPTLPFQDSHAPRAPHSFPTRRSSDLSVTWAGEPVGGIRVSAVSHIEKSMTFPLAVSRGKRQRVTIEVIEQDRKSTRLNSSHVSISYAVFCLKKKKTTKVIIPGAIIVT